MDEIIAEEIAQGFLYKSEQRQMYFPWEMSTENEKHDLFKYPVHAMLSLSVCEFIAAGTMPFVHS